MHKKRRKRIHIISFIICQSDKGEKSVKMHLVCVNFLVQKLIIIIILSHLSFITLQNLNLNLKAPKTKIFEFANNVDTDEVAHYEPPHLALHCLP